MPSPKKSTSPPVNLTYLSSSMQLSLRLQRGGSLSACCSSQRIKTVARLVLPCLLSSKLPDSAIAVQYSSDATDGCLWSRPSLLSWTRQFPSMTLPAKHKRKRTNFHLPNGLSWNVVICGLWLLWLLTMVTQESQSA